MALTAGTTLGPYEIVAALNSGGMGEVYKARDTRLDRTVAIKILPAHLAADPQFGQRFEREARIISQLNHPHICTLHDVGRQGGIEYLVLERALHREQLRRRDDLDRHHARGELAVHVGQVSAMDGASDPAGRCGIRG